MTYNNNKTVLGVRVLLQLSTRMLGSAVMLALLLIPRITMDPQEYPVGLPENLKPEYLKYIQDPKKYARMYPVCMKLLSKYLGIPNGKEKDQRQSRKQ